MAEMGEMGCGPGLCVGVQCCGWMKKEEGGIGKTRRAAARQDERARERERLHWGGRLRQTEPDKSKALLVGGGGRRWATGGVNGSKRI